MIKSPVFAVLCLCALLASCSSGNRAIGSEPASTTQPTVAAVLEPSDQPIQPSNTTPPVAAAFPQTVNLPFQPLQLSPLQEGKPQADWTSVHSLSFSAFQGKPIELTVYQKPKDEAALLPQQLDIAMNLQGKTYIIRDVSADLLEDKAVGSTVVFNRTFSSDKKDYYFLGGVELFAIFPITKAKYSLSFPKTWIRPLLTSTSTTKDSIPYWQVTGIHK